VLIEPLSADPDQAVRRAAEMEDIAIAVGITLEQIQHGDGITSRAVNQRHGIRISLEDTPVLPDGREAQSNVQLIRTAVLMIGARPFDRSRTARVPLNAFRAGMAGTGRQ
jgi:uncharacterized protein (DUF849 family)